MKKRSELKNRLVRETVKGERDSKKGKRPVLSELTFMSYIDILSSVKYKIRVLLYGFINLKSDFSYLYLTQNTACRIEITRHDKKNKEENNYGKKSVLQLSLQAR